METALNRPVENQKILALEIDDFSFAYAVDKECEPAPVVTHLSASIEQGAFVVLTGVTGQGKTTLLRCCKPELAPEGTSSGSIRVFGRDISSLTPLESAEYIGFVAQNPDNQIVCDTVWHEMAFGLENIGMPQEEMRRRIAEISHFFGIEPWFRKQTDSLSGGEKQLLTVAGVLALRPRILLLDEPTSQLDPVAEKDFLHALFRVNRELGLTVVVVTHAPETMLAYATAFLVLTNNGIEQRELHVPTAMPTLSQSHVEWQLIGQDQASAKQAAILRDAFCRYSRTDDFVLRGTHLYIGEGTIHALVGGNGCGKSTLLKTIAKQIKLERGSCTNYLAAQLAYLPQNPKNLFVCDSVLEELQEWQAACGYSDDDIATALDNCGLTAAASRHPYDLSGGQQQLLALEKILLAKPRFVLMDEPTKGLDAETKLAVAKRFAQLQAEGITLFFATHDLSFVYCIAQTVSMLFDGEIACTQPALDFFNQNLFFKPAPDVFTALWTKENGVDTNQTGIQNHDHQTEGN